MVEIIALVLKFIVPAIALTFEAIIPFAGSVLVFTFSRIPKFPRYIKLLQILYTDTESDTQARKYITLVLLILGSILTFMTYSLIPSTSIPIIGTAMTSVAFMLAVVVSLAGLDFIFNLNEGFYLRKITEDQNKSCDIVDDISELSKILGKSWTKIMILFEELLPKLEEKIYQNPEALNALTNFIDRQIDGLLLYFETGKLDTVNASELEKNKLTQQIMGGIEPWKKMGGSLGEGLIGGGLTGIGVQNIAAAIFVKAGLWTSIQSFLGLSGGIVVGASTYTLLTIVAPLGWGAVAAAGIYQGAIQLRTQQERKQMSSFITDVLIAALPMAWIDGEFSTEEKDTIHKMLLNPAILKEDRERVYDAIESEKDWDDILITDLLIDPKNRQNNDKISPVEKMKHRLLLSVAWEIAKADGRIDDLEMQLHNRMAKTLPTIENWQETVSEIRRLVILESGSNLQEKISVIQGDITQQSVHAIVSSADETLSVKENKNWFSWVNPEEQKEVDLAIHKAAGKELLKECQKFQSCQTGEVRITSAYQLPASWIIHTVSPTWEDGNNQEEELLRQCYHNVLKLAQNKNIKTVAFPALGTGTRNFPLEKAADIAISEIKKGSTELDM